MGLFITLFEGETAVKNRYLDFLCEIVGGTDEYSRLLGELHGIEFYSLIPNDDNRGEDGKQLREKFADERGQHALSLCLTDPCTVLEMLIGLSFRLEFETAQSRWEKTPDEWFWILIDNLDLTCYDDSVFLDDEMCYTLFSKVSQMLERHYESDGNGGLFPLKHPKKDQRRVELWYQMSAYVLENYPI